MRFVLGSAFILNSTFVAARASPPPLDLLPPVGTFLPVADFSSFPVPPVAFEPGAGVPVPLAPGAGVGVELRLRRLLRWSVRLLPPKSVMDSEPPSKLLERFERERDELLRWL